MRIFSATDERVMREAAADIAVLARLTDGITFQIPWRERLFTMLENIDAERESQRS